MKVKIYKVWVNGRIFIKTISKDLAERTLAMARAYNLEGSIEEGVDDRAPATEKL